MLVSNWKGEWDIKKIKITSNKKSRIGDYTFLNDENIFPDSPSQLSTSTGETDHGAQTKIKKTDEKYKKKKALNKDEIAKSGRGLKFLNYSQRNHSSVYE